VQQYEERRQEREKLKIKYKKTNESMNSLRRSRNSKNYDSYYS
jgi:hypothetical protein